MFKIPKIIFLILIFSIVFILLAEAGLRILLPNDKFFLWPPSRKIIFKPYPGIMPGVASSPAVFLSNSQGIRGDELTDKKRLKILAVGGSTTECLYIDQRKSWPYLLQEKLSLAYKDNVWVGNIGRSGLSTTANLIELKYLLPQLKKIDLIVVLAGFNDLQSSLLGVYVSNSLKSDEEKIGMVFVLHPTREKNPLKHSEFLRLFRKIKGRFLRQPNEFLEDSAGSWYIAARNSRRNAKQVIDQLPDLKQSLDVFENNIKDIITLSREKGVRIVFLTQPYLWKNNLTDSEKNLLWFGYTADKQKYYSIGALIEGIEGFNNRLKEVCFRSGAECIDLNKLLPKDTSIFYDDVHFNENGCQEVAGILFKYLKH